MAWDIISISNVSEVSSGNLTLNAPSGAQEGDLLVACIGYRSNAAFSPNTAGDWTIVATQQSSGDTDATSGIASGGMWYKVRGASDPDFQFNRTGGDVAEGYVLCYRGVNTASPYDTGGAGTLASLGEPSLGQISAAEANELLVAMVVSGDNNSVTTFDAATNPSVASGSIDTTTDPTLNTWIQRINLQDNTGADIGVAIADAVKVDSGSTGTFSAVDVTATTRSAFIVGAFKLGVEVLAINIHDDTNASDVLPNEPVESLADIIVNDATGTADTPTVNLVYYIEDFVLTVGAADTYTVNVFDATGTAESIGAELPDSLAVNVQDSVRAEEIGQAVKMDLGDVLVFDSKGIAEYVNLAMDDLLVSVFDAQGSQEWWSAGLDDLAINVFDSTRAEEVPAPSLNIEFNIFVFDSKGSSDVVVDIVASLADIIVFDAQGSADIISDANASLADINVFDAKGSADIVSDSNASLADIIVNDSKGTQDIVSDSNASLADIVVNDSARAEEITPIGVQIGAEPDLDVNVFDATGSADLITISNASLADIFIFDNTRAEEIGLAFALDDLAVSVFDAQGTSDVPTVSLGAVPDCDIDVFDATGTADIASAGNSSLGDISVFDASGTADVFDGSASLADISVLDSTHASDDEVDVEIPSLGDINVFDAQGSADTITAENSALGDISVFDAQGISENITSNASLADIVVNDASGTAEALDTTGDLGNINVNDSTRASELNVKAELESNIDVFDAKGSLDVITSILNTQLGDINIYDESHASEDITVIVEQVGSYSVSVTDPVGASDVPTVALDDLAVSVFDATGSLDILPNAPLIPDYYLEVQDVTGTLDVPTVEAEASSFLEVNVFDACAAIDDAPVAFLENYALSVQDSTRAQDIVAVEVSLEVNVFDAAGSEDVASSAMPDALEAFASDTIAISEDIVIGVFDEFLAVNVFETIAVQDSGGVYFVGQAEYRFVFKNRTFYYIINDRKWHFGMRPRRWRFTFKNDN